MPKTLKILLLALMCQMITVAAAWSVEVGEPMPEFGIKTLSGEVVSRTTLSGKPVLIVFWNTWCPSCKKELPEINQLAKTFAPRGLAVLAVNTGLNDSESKARAYWKKNGFLYHAGFDRYFDVGQSFGVRGVPTVVMVDAWGIVRYKSASIPPNMEERMRQLYTR
jgi:thiol-disulfide isomerase/thioredoxin